MAKVLKSNMFCLLLTHSLHLSTPQHTSTHLSTLQHHVSYDAPARLWADDTVKPKEGKMHSGKFAQQETGPREGREEA